MPKIDMKHHAAATSAAYHMHASVEAVQAGFMQGGITPLLQDPDLAAVVRDVHEAASLAWQHPSDGDALLYQLHKGGAFDADDSDRKECVPACFSRGDGSTARWPHRDHNHACMPMITGTGCRTASLS